jgi:DNA-binding NarL/FixJ family response regulator
MFGALTSMKRIMIADDHDAVRAGIRAVLELRAGWEIVAEARDGKEAIASVLQTQPDVAIIDYSMPFMTGIEVARRVKERKLVTEVLLYTMYDSVALQSEARQAGVRAFLLKSDPNKMLLSAVESLMLHKSFCGHSTRSDKGSAPGRNRVIGISLSPRETTIVKLIVEGHSNKSISLELNLSIKTTETHRAAAMRKLNVNCTADLVRYAVRNNLVEA